MNTSALIMMIAAIGIVTMVTVFYFYKAFTTPPRPVEDGHGDVMRPDVT
ncbi:MAG: hypothetical protein IPO27_06580 [Bacteroidetes bacterium]|nr:hypothetical protein [Bacteroidota bacterium]